MKNYCRYCGACNDIGVNDYYCSIKEIFLTEQTVKSWACKDFGDCGIDIITGKGHKERKSTTRRLKINDGEQVTLSIAKY